MAQSAVGFGYALFATPLLVWTGVPLPSLISLVATCAMIQAAIGARKLHATVPWRLSLTATAIRLASVIIGLLMLKRLVVLNTNHIRMVIGCILCLLAVIYLHHTERVNCTFESSEHKRAAYQRAFRILFDLPA